MQNPHTNINIKQCIKLYKAKVLTEKSDEFFHNHGYEVKRINDVVKIVPVKQVV